MKRHVSALASALVLSAAAHATAQNGASSVWQTRTFVAVATGDYVVTLAGPGFEGCLSDDEAYPFYGVDFEFFGPIPGMTWWSVQGVDSAPVIPLHVVAARSGAFNFGWVGEVAVRVYKGAGVADLFRATPRCRFLRVGPLVASGLARFNMSDADDGLTGPGVNQWGWVLKGTLENVALPGCGPTVELSMLRRWVNRSNVDSSLTKLTAAKGPSLSCR